MNFKKLSQIVFVCLVGFLAFASCSEGEKFDQAEIAEIDTEDDETIDDLLNDGLEVSISGYDEANAPVDGRVETDERIRCADVTHDEENQTITIDFGEGCEGPHGRVRSGTIFITYTGGFREPGSVITTELQDYSINDIMIEGTRVVNVSLNENDNLVLDVSLTNGKITWPDGTVASREAERSKTWIRGSNRSQDEFRVTGSATGTNRRGVDYTSEVTDTIVFKRSCAISKVFIPVEGSKTITTATDDIIIDFGDGECDKTITITTNGETKEITYKRWRRLKR